MRISTLAATAVVLTALAVGPTALAELREAPAASVTETHPDAPAAPVKPAVTKAPSTPKKPAPSKPKASTKAPAPKPAKPKPRLEEPDIAWEIYCDEEGKPYGVKPNTAEMRAYAVQMCADEQRALERVGWADGVL